MPSFQKMITIGFMAAYATAGPAPSATSQESDNLEAADSDRPAETADNQIEIFPATVQGPDVTALSPTPADLPADLQAFLAKYQPLANAASDRIGSKNEARFTTAGHCFADYPCFSVERGAAATIGAEEEIGQKQVAAILDSLTSNPTVLFDKDGDQDTRAPGGLTLTVNSATLKVISPPGHMKSDILAGMVFDMYKMQHSDPSTNSIRAVQARTDGQERPFVALCLYPEGADAEKVHNFCLGKHLDGTQAFGPNHKTKRALEGMLGMACSFVDVPILCDLF